MFLLFPFTSTNCPHHLRKINENQDFRRKDVHKNKELNSQKQNLLVLMGECKAKKLLITFEMFLWLLRLLLLGGAAEAALPSSEPVASITASSTSILTLLLFVSLTPSLTSGTKILQIKPILPVFQFFTDFFRFTRSSIWCSIDFSKSFKKSRWKRVLNYYNVNS